MGSRLVDDAWSEETTTQCQRLPNPRRAKERCTDAGLMKDFDGIASKNCKVRTHINLCNCSIPCHRSFPSSRVSMSASSHICACSSRASTCARLCHAISRANRCLQLQVVGSQPSNKHHEVSPSCSDFWHRSAFQRDNLVTPQRTT